MLVVAHSTGIQSERLSKRGEWSIHVHLLPLTETFPLLHVSEDRDCILRCLCCFFGVLHGLGRLSWAGQCLATEFGQALSLFFRKAEHHRGRMPRVDEYYFVETSGLIGFREYIRLITYFSMDLQALYHAG